MLESRFVVIDFNHLAHKYQHGMQTVLTKRVTIGGVTKEIVTNLQNGVSKLVYRWTRGGLDVPVICFDRPCPGRKELLQELYPSGQAYKGSRRGMSSDLFEAITMCESLFREAGVFVAAANGYEADDAIMAAVSGLKQYGQYIDVVTGDMDMIPLVDDQVSVFYSSRKTTSAISKEIEKRKYVQVTPSNYEEVVSDYSKNKTSKIRVPYNYELLVKMLRGDDSDEIPRIPTMRPKRVNEIIKGLADNGVGDIFRYGGYLDVITLVLLPLVLHPEAFKWVDSKYFTTDAYTSNYEKVFDELFDAQENPVPSLSRFKGLGADGLGGFDDLSKARKNYRIMDLNSDLGGRRRSVSISEKPRHFDGLRYADVFSKLGIKIPLGSY